MSIRYRRRAPPVARTSAPFTIGKKSVSLQIKEQLKDAEKNREESYQRRRKELIKRIDARVKQLEEYQKSLKKKPQSIPVKSEEDIIEGIKGNSEIVSNTKIYVDASGQELKVNEKTQDILSKSARFYPPSKRQYPDLYNNPGKWVKIDSDGQGPKPQDKWTLKELRDSMKILIAREETFGASPLTKKETSKGENVHIKSSIDTSLWQSIELLYDSDSEELWARLPKEETSLPDEITEQEVARISGVVTDDNPFGYGGN